MHTDTRFGTYLFSVGTHLGNLLVSSRFLTGDLNFCIHIIPLWEPYVEKPVMLKHQCIGLLEEHCSNYINVKSADTSAVGKFTTAWVWHKAEQIIWVNLAFSHMLGCTNPFVCTSVCLCRIYGSFFWKLVKTVTKRVKIQRVNFLMLLFGNESLTALV